MESPQGPMQPPPPFENISLDLKALQRFCVTNQDKKPRNLEWQLISPSNPEEWESDWNACEKFAREHGYIGTLLMPEYGIICIDIDAPMTAESKAQQERLRAALAKFPPTYREYSMSGRGEHVFYRTSIPIHNVTTKFDVQIWCDRHYIALTGNLAPGSGPSIASSEELDAWLTTVMGKPRKEITWQDTPSQPERATDEEILQRMLVLNTAGNAYRIRQLWNGEFSGDHSAADMELLDALESFSGNKEQVRRLFLKSGMARDLDRKGNHKDDYVYRSVSKAFAKNTFRLDPLEIAELVHNSVSTSEESTVVPQGTKGNLVEVMEEIRAKEAERLGRLEEDRKYIEIPRPQGLMGEIYDFALASTQKPSPESSMAAAIAFMSLLASQYELRGLRPNLFMLLIGESGIGKNVVHEVPPTLIDLAARRSGGIRRGVHIMERCLYGMPASSAGFGRLTEMSPESLVLATEMGGMLNRIMTDRGRDRNAVEVRERLLALYGESKKGAKSLERVYSQAENNQVKVVMPFMTFVGDTQPGVFYDSFDETGVETGMLQRFLVFRATGEYRCGEPLKPEFNVYWLDYIVDLLDGVGLGRGEPVERKVGIGPNPSNPVATIAMDVETGVGERFDQYGKDYQTGLHNRAIAFVKKLSMLHCISRREGLVVSHIDVDWAEAVFRHHKGVLEKTEAKKVSGVEGAILELADTWARMPPKERVKKGAPKELCEAPNVIDFSWLVTALSRRKSLWPQGFARHQVKQALPGALDDMGWAVGKASELMESVGVTSGRRIAVRMSTDVNTM